MSRTHHGPRPEQPRLAPVVDPSAVVQETYERALLAQNGSPLNIFSTMAHNPAVLKRFTNYAGYFLNKGLLPAREREIVILRVGANCHAVYEFGQHTVIGERAGLSSAEIVALAGDVRVHAWSDTDRDLIAMADELCEDDCVSGSTWERLSARWNEAELVELVMVAGTYRLVSGFLNTMGVQLDEGTPGWPVSG